MAPTRLPASGPTVRSWDFGSSARGRSRPATSKRSEVRLLGGPGRAVGIFASVLALFLLQAVDRAHEAEDGQKGRGDEQAIDENAEEVVLA